MSFLENPAFHQLNIFFDSFSETNSLFKEVLFAFLQIFSGFTLKDSGLLQRGLGDPHLDSKILGQVWAAPMGSLTAFCSDFQAQTDKTR